MNKSLLHRGPDDDGLFLKDSIGLGHRRLAIIDLVSGHQPMVDDQRGRALVYNGEIYNFQDLRDELTSRGIAFTTHSDTEVLLYLADLSSMEWLERLNGMFAFAMWDHPSRSLLLARDRVGKKPLYYVHLGDEFIFASEIKALLRHPRVIARINMERMPEYLAFRSICGTETMFDGVVELEPGHALLISQQDFRPKLVPYWREGENKKIADFVDPARSTEDQFSQLLLDSVKYRLISDVPVGSFNSGGVDSSLVTAMMRSLTQGELHTFSVGFEEPLYDESRFAAIVANKLGTHHHTLVINEAHYTDSLPEVVAQLEEPINHAHTIQFLHISRFAKQYVTVILTGEGSDELFGGYPRYQIPLLAHYLRYAPQILSKGLLALAESAGQRRLVKLLENAAYPRKAVIENSRFTPLQDFELLFPDNHRFHERELVYERATAKNGTLLGQLLYFDQRTYLPALLNRLDKMSMAGSLESRVPFLDYRMVEWSALLPDRYKIKLGRMNKVIVKKVAERWLPEEIVYREKVGFGVPLAQWFRNRRGLGRYLDLLTDKTFRERSFFDVKSVERLVREHVSEGVDHHEILWGLVNLELWCRTFIDKQRLSGEE